VTGHQTVLVPSVSGNTALAVSKALGEGVRIIALTHVADSRGPMSRN